MNHRFTTLSRGLRRTRGEMNKTEREYADVLDRLMLTGEVADYWFEPFSLRLTDGGNREAKNVSYTPDFLVLMADGVTFVDDVKGGLVDDAALVRLKAAATKFPLWQFRLVQKLRKRDGGGWKVINI